MGCPASPHAPWAAAIPSASSGPKFWGSVDPLAGRGTGHCKAWGRAQAGTGARELQEQQTAGVCRAGGLYLAPFIFLPPFEAAPSEQLLRAASVTKTRPVRRKKQLRGGRQIRRWGPEVLPPPAAHPGPPPPSLWRESTRGLGTSSLAVMEKTGKSRILRERVAAAAQREDADVPSAVHPGGAL